MLCYTEPYTVKSSLCLFFLFWCAWCLELVRVRLEGALLVRSANWYAKGRVRSVDAFR